MMETHRIDGTRQDRKGQKRTVRKCNDRHLLSMTDMKEKKYGQQQPH